MPEDSMPIKDIAAEGSTRINRGGGSQAIIPLADRTSSEDVISRMNSTVGAVVARNINKGDLMIAVVIMVTPHGLVHWETQEGDVGTPADPEKVMQMGSARLGVAHALGAVSEQMRNGLKQDRK